MLRRRVGPARRGEGMVVVSSKVWPQAALLVSQGAGLPHLTVTGGAEAKQKEVVGHGSYAPIVLRLTSGKTGQRN